MELPSRRLFSLLTCLAFAGLPLAANAAAPTLTTINVIVGGNEDAVVSIPYATLAAAANEADADNDAIDFRFKSLIAGTCRSLLKYVSPMLNRALFTTLAGTILPKSRMEGSDLLKPPPHP